MSARAPARKAAPAGRAPEHRVILASAGTGKTHQLTNRFLALIAAGESCDRILATTFTRKAAGEILRKIVSRLSEGAGSDKAAQALGEQIGATALNSAGCVRLLESVVRALDRLWIGTIDSFFARLAAGNALAMLGTPGEQEAISRPGVSWRMIDADEDANLRSQAVLRILREGRRNELLELVRNRDPGYAARSVHADLLGAVDQAYHAFLTSDKDVWGGVPVPPPLGGKELAAAITALHAWTPPIAKSTRRPYEKWDKAKQKLVAGAEANRWKDFVGQTLIGKIVAGDDHYDRAEITDETRSVLWPLITHAAAVLLAPLPERSKATWELLSRFDEAYRSIKQARGLWTFDDVPRTLAEHAATDSAQEMYYRLDARLHHVLLDEFQDTSVAQWRLLEPIVDEVVSQGGERSFLCVGDVKQSLYSWRQARPDLLPEITRRWTHLKPETLEASWRSSPVIIDAVNRIMGGFNQNLAFATPRCTPGVLEAIRAWQADFRPHSTNKKLLPGFVRLSTSGDHATAAGKCDVAIRDAAKRIKELHEAAPHLSIGVLFRAGRHIAAMKIELLRIGIQASEEGGNPLADSPSVAAMLSMLTLADHPERTSAALFHVAASPLAPVVGLAYPSALHEVAEVATRVRSGLLSEGYAAVIEDWVRRVAPSCSERDLSRLDQLVSLAVHFDERSRWDPCTRPSAFVEFVKQRRVEDPSAAPVRLMTVHASKGLEFHTVVLPWIEDPPLANQPPPILDDRPDDPLARPTLVTVCPNKAVVALSPELSRMYERWRAREVLEEFCVLYVAITRAIHALEIFVPPKSDPLSRDKGTSISFAKIVRGALHPDAAGPNKELWTHGDPGWAAQVPSEPRAEPAPRESTLPAVRLDLSPASRTRHTPRRSPTAAAFSGYGLWPGLDESASASSRSRGILFHEWLALIEWLDQGPPSEPELISAAAALDLPSRPDLELLANEFLRALQRPALRKLLVRSSYAGALVEARREVPFSARDEQGGMIVGRMDRLVVVRAAGGALERAEVIDFKTDALADSSPAALRAHAQTYHAQMQDYQRTAARLLGCDARAVGIKLVFVSHDAVIDL